MDYKSTFDKKYSDINWNELVMTNPKIKQYVINKEAFRDSFKIYPMRYLDIRFIREMRLYEKQVLEKILNKKEVILNVGRKQPIKKYI